MNDEQLDLRLGALLRDAEPMPDPAFNARVLAAARLDRQIREVRRRAWRRASIDCAVAVAVAGSFYLLTQAQAPSPDGIIALQAPAMAGLVMLALWAVVSLPISGIRHRLA